MSHQVQDLGPDQASETHAGAGLAAEFGALREQVARSILGQANLIERLLIALPFDLCVNCHAKDGMVSDDGKPMTNYKKWLAAAEPMMAEPRSRAWYELVDAR